MGRRRFGGERSRPGSAAPSGGRIKPRRSPGRRSSSPTSCQPICNADVVMKAGRLAAEYFVYKGRIPASLLLDADHRSRGNYLPPPPERRAPSPRDEDGHWRRSRDERRRPRKRSRGRKDDDDYDDRRRRGSELGDRGRKRGREKLWGKRGWSKSENAGSEDDLSPGLHHRRGRSRIASGDSGSGKVRDVADGVRGHADGRSERQGRRRGRDDDRRGSRRDKEEVKPGRSSKVSTKHRSSAGCTSPKSSRRRGVGDCSSDSHASRANGSKRGMLVGSHVQSAKPVNESINPQDESCRSSLALKETVVVMDASEHDTSAHFSKREEINKGGASSPPKTNEHFPRGLKESVAMVDASEHDTSTPFDKREEISGGMVSSPSKVSQMNEHSPQGLKETLAMVDANKHDTSAHFCKREEINKGGASSPSKVSQMNEHSSRGLKETLAMVDASKQDTFAHFSKREEINKGGASSPPKVSQTIEHSPRGLRETLAMVYASEHDTYTPFDNREEINGGIVSSPSKVSETNEHSPRALKETLALVDASKHDTSAHFIKREEVNKGGASPPPKVSRTNEHSLRGLKESVAMVDASEQDTSTPFDKREEINGGMVSSPSKVSQTNEYSPWGLKETLALVDASKHDTFAHFSKREKINKGGASSPPKVSQTNEHSPRSLKESVAMVDASEHDTSTPFDKREEINGRMVSSPSKVSQTNKHSPWGLKETLELVDASKHDTYTHFSKREEINKGGASSPRGLKETLAMVDASEHDTYTHFSKREEIDGEMVSSPPNVSQMNEHSPLSNLNAPQVDEDRRAAHKSPKANRRKVIESFSNDSLANLANAPEISHIQSIESLDKSINPQDESCRSLQGLKEETVLMVDVSEHNTSASTDKEEEIDKGRASSPMEVFQTNKHSPSSNLNAPQVDEESWAAHRSQEANRRKVTESFSNDPLANLANTLEISHIQSVESMDKSINPQDESCWSFQGLKEETVMMVDMSEHDTSAHIDKGEEIGKERASSPLEVSQMNEHSPLSNLNPQVDEERCAARRSPEANQGKVVESFSSVSLANLSNALDSSHVQYVELMEKSINSQDESCQTLQGLKATVVMVGVREDDTSAHFDEKEEINRGSVSSPVKLSKANEYSPFHNLRAAQTYEEMTETFNQEQPTGHSVTPKCGSEYVVKVEEEKHVEPVSYKICDLNLVVSPEMSEIPSDSFWRNDEPTPLTSESKENISVDFGLRTGNNIIGNGHDSSWISSNGKLVPIIFLDDDSEAEDDVRGSSKPKSEASYSSTENARNQMPPRDGIPGFRDG